MPIQARRLRLQVENALISFLTVSSCFLSPVPWALGGGRASRLFEEGGSEKNTRSYTAAPTQSEREPPPLLRHRHHPPAPPLPLSTPSIPAGSFIPLFLFSILSIPLSHSAKNACHFGDLPLAPPQFPLFVPPFLHEHFCFFFSGASPQWPSLEPAFCSSAHSLAAHLLFPLSLFPLFLRIPCLFGGPRWSSRSSPELQQGDRNEKGRLQSVPPPPEVEEPAASGDKSSIEIETVVSRLHGPPPLDHLLEPPTSASHTACCTLLVKLTFFCRHFPPALSHKASPIILFLTRHQNQKSILIAFFPPFLSPTTLCKISKNTSLLFFFLSPFAQRCRQCAHRLFGREEKCAR